MKNQSLIYYAGRVVQRLSLLYLIGWTAIHWIVLIQVTTSLGLFSQTGVKFDNPEIVSTGVRNATTATSYRVLSAGIGAAVITLAFLLIPRVRKFEKSLVVDSLVIITFCLVGVATSQILLKSFLMRVNI